VDLFIAPSIWLLQHSLLRGSTMFVPFYSTGFLAFESGNVIGLRMMKMMSGGSGLHEEAHLMVMEKVQPCLRPVRTSWLAARRAA
jgi:hypothetical protein